ncbi:Ppx/GppA phosphatase family protein [Paenibacillus sp. 481]|uniref:Ppx/GppA phosphatase family protein n=1 Tax=Paenibacillus sp. 481 TaxID=2835869 RepID=UPI001E4FAE44|nr:Ppx/GppA phosphatase family protein [Paenibacillus sp. 481]UHA74551.1 Ppx/GppA family phosphatase [Paenibacillus sp. 481]
MSQIGTEIEFDGERGTAMKHGREHRETQMRYMGIIDVGSNSVRLMIVKYNEHYFQVVYQWKEVVRLGDEFDAHGAIPEAKIDKLISILHLFNQMCSKYKPYQMHAVATAALRRATNRREIVRRVENVTGVTLNIIGGESEAYLDYVAVISTMNISDGLMMDIGGGSLELALIRNRELVESCSIPIGALTIAQQFSVQAQLTEQEEQRISQFIANWLERIPWLEEAHGLPLIGLGGTVRTLAKLESAASRIPFPTLHHHVLHASFVQSTFDSLKRLSLEEKERVSGLCSERADIIVGSLQVVAHVMNRLQAQYLIVCRKGVRDGMMFDLLRAEGMTVEQPLLFSIYNFRQRLELPNQSGAHVHRLFRMLVQQCAPVLGLEGNWTNIIQTSALLHDCGEVISPLERERHALYMLLNADLYGLTPRELVLSGCIASINRQLKFERAWRAYEPLLLPGDKRAVQMLGALLRLAVSFSATSVVHTVNCVIDQHEVIVYVQADTPPLLEVTEAYAIRTGFRKLFDRYLVIMADVSPALI